MKVGRFSITDYVHFHYERIKFNKNVLFDSLHHAFKMNQFAAKLG